MAVATFARDAERVVVCSALSMTMRRKRLHQVIVVMGGALDRGGHARQVVERLADAIGCDVADHPLHDRVGPLGHEPVLCRVEDGRCFGRHVKGAHRAIEHRDDLCLQRERRHNALREAASNHAPVGAVCDINHGRHSLVGMG